MFVVFWSRGIVAQADSHLKIINDLALKKLNVVQIIFEKFFRMLGPHLGDIGFS